MNQIAQLMRYATAHANDLTSRLLKERTPHLYVAEFPRSGANWLRNMIGDVLQLPVPRFAALPVTFRAVLQTHSPRPFDRVPTIYLVRDGRDVFLSHYYKAVNSALHANPAVRARVLHLHPSLSQYDAEALRAAAALAPFFAEWRRRSLGARTNWGAHVRNWTSVPQPERLVARYEDLVSDPSRQLQLITRHLSGHTPAPYVLNFAVTRNSFSEQTGRTSGEIDNTSNRRAGTIGLWRSGLPREIAQAFLDEFGAELELMGYDTSLH